MTPAQDMITARYYIADGLADYGYDLAKSQSAVCLHNGNLNKAISWTRVALYIRRIRRYM